VAEYLDRETILEEALRVLARHGFRKTSLRDITHGLGVGKTAIYHHFPGGKPELIDACLQREEETVLAEMRIALAQHDDPRDQIRAIVGAKLAHIGKLRDVLAIDAAVGRELGNIYRQHERRFTLSEERLLETILDHGQELGIFRPGGTRLLARVLRGFLAQLEIDFTFGRASGHRRDEFEAAFELLFHGLVTPDHQPRSSS